METNQAKPQNMIDTTDALEAVGACRSMKNFLFTLILVGLVVCQGIFWMNHFGLINEDGRAVCENAAQTTCPKDPCSDECKPQVNAQDNARGGAIVSLAATTKPPNQISKTSVDPEMAEMQQEVYEQVFEDQSIEKAIDQIVESANQGKPEVLGDGETDILPAKVTDPIAEEAADDTQPASKQPAEKPGLPQISLSLFRISAPFAASVVAVCNFIIIVSVILYCLSLLMCLKISLAGRLGGINHIARAFFISLFLLVIITPWQVVLPKVLIGVTWLPGELLCGGWDKADSSIFWKVLLYLRFCGLWFVAVWLLLWTHIRSGKWTRATLRRLGVVR